MLGMARPPPARWRLGCRVSCALPGWPGMRASARGSRTRSRARSRLAAAGGDGGSATPARADRGRWCSPATSACSGRCIPGGRSCGGCPVTPGWWSPSRSVTGPVPGMRCLSKLGVIGKGPPGCCPSAQAPAEGPVTGYGPGACTRRPVVPRTSGRLALARGPPPGDCQTKRTANYSLRNGGPGRGAAVGGRQERPGGTPAADSGGPSAGGQHEAGSS
jgi:hypothetical protein